MAISKKNIVLFILGFATGVAAVIATDNLRQEQLPKEKDGSPMQAAQNTGTYPDHLLEGKIVRINISDRTVVINARLSRIDANLGEEERAIKVDNAEVVTYNLATKVEMPFDISGLDIGDDILIATVESNRDATATRLQYTAVKITKFIGKAK